MIAERKNERLIACIALRSVERRRVMKIPMIAVTIPIAGTINGKIKPALPNPALPRIKAATSVTA